MDLLITRAKEESEYTALCLKKRQFNSHSIPIMALRIDVSVLESKITELISASGFMFTSQNALRAMQKCPLIFELKDTPIFAVGDRTAELARETGFRKVYSAQGNAADLVKMIRQFNFPNGTRLMHLSGDVTRCDLSKAFQLDNLDVEKIVVYSMIRNEKFSEKLHNLIVNIDLDGVLVFSARNAEILAELIIKDTRLDFLRKIPFYCLSNTVAEPLRYLSKNVFVAKRPTMRDLIDIIQAPV